MATQHVKQLVCEDPSLKICVFRHERFGQNNGCLPTVRCSILDAGRRLDEYNGLGPDRLQVRLSPNGEHHESTWRLELPDTVRFLFGPEGDPSTR